MDPTPPRPQESRKRRRRRDERLPLQAKLSLDIRAKGYVGSISRDLARDLFGDATIGTVHHVAIASWQPPTQTLLEDGSWTIVPVKTADGDSPPSSLRFPSSSSALQSFNSSLQGDPRMRNGVEVLVIDVQPLPLQTVFLRVDGNALKKHEDVQKKFGGGFQPLGIGSIGKSKGRPVERPRSPPQGLDDELRKAVRTALTTPTIVHKNDLFSIPLPAHPITHVPFPPVEVMLCEPVNQGIISGETRIVIDIDSKGKTSIARHAMQNSRPISYHGVLSAESGDDTSMEQFYSAAEGGSTTDAITSEDQPDEFSATESETDDESLSDEDNAISLSQPSLPPQASGVLSSMTAATPRPFGARTNGIASPGSVFSGYTATTARGLPAAKSFEVKPLIKKIPDSILQPPPPSDDDDESRVYVDVKLLVRIGCFSGDWVKLTVAPSPNSKDGLWPMGAFGDDEFEQNCRTVKVYGLPDLAAAEALSKQKSGMARRGSISSVLAFARPSPSAYISPILFANLSKPTNVTLGPLSSQAGESRVVRSKVPSSATPPIAKEITLLRLPTPAATERSTQAGLFASLKHHFEGRRRLLQTGDLVAVPMDVNTSRMLAENPSHDADNDLEDLLFSSDTAHDSAGSTEVAWFKVGQIQRQAQDEAPSSTDPVIWADVSSIEAPVTRIAQVGSEPAAVPTPLEVPWDYYLGAKARPRLSGPSVPAESLSSIARPYTAPLQRRLRELFAVSSSPRALKLGMPPVVVLLHSTQRGIGKATAVSQATSELGLHYFPIDAYDLVSEGGAGGGDVKTEATLRHRVERALQCGVQYTVPLIRHAEALTAERTATAIKELLDDLRVLVLTTTELDKIPETVRSLVTHELEVAAPDEAEREVILHSIVQERGIRLAPEVDLKSIAVKTAALVAGDLVDVLERASVLRQLRLEDLASSEVSSAEPLIRDLLVSGGPFARCLTKADLDTAVESARKSFADSIGAPKIPNVTWDDVGGLAHVKDAVMETIQLPLERPELFAKGMKKRSGILFYGPPGTGKTLLAKAIATEFSLNFFSVKGPELLNMYIGESEANVRRVFQRARDARPCVVFFDELDSVAPKRGNQGDSGGVMDRIVSQLLAELDGMSGGDGGSTGGGGGVFVIGATNRPDLLDQALLRPGRFDKMLYLGIADTHEKQLTILEALTRKFTLDPSLDLRNVAERLPFLYTGADVYALCSDAMLKAITRKASAVDEKIKRLPGGPVSTAYFFDHMATKEDIEVTVTEADFVAAQNELVGSVSAKELEHYQRVRQTFEAPDASAAQSKGQLPNTTQSCLIPPKAAGMSHRPKPNARHQTPAAVKGNGKTTQTEQDDESEEEEDDEDAYITSNDSPYHARTLQDKGKGKGKAAANGDFEDAADNDDETLYG